MVRRSEGQARKASTLIKQEFKTKGIVAAIFGRIFAGGSYRGSFQGELNAFAKLAEREPSLNYT